MRAARDRLVPITCLLRCLRYRCATTDALKAMEKTGLVEVIPFALDKEDAMAKARILGYLQGSGTRYAGSSPSWAMFKSLFRMFREDTDTGWLDPFAWVIRKIHGIYVPLWHIHGMARFECRISKRRENRHYLAWTTGLTMPGFSWAPLDKLHLQLNDQQLDEDLELFEVDKHQVDDTIVLPFSRSPLGLTATLQRLAEGSRDLSRAQEAVEDESRSCHESAHPLLKKPMVILKPPKEGDDRLQVEPFAEVMLQHTSLRAKIAAYPILAPYYIIEYEDPMDDNARHTMALRADKMHSEKSFSIFSINASRVFWSLWQICQSCGKGSWTDLVMKQYVGNAGVLPKGESRPSLEFKVRPDLTLTPVNVENAVRHVAGTAILEGCCDTAVENCLARLLYAPRDNLELGGVDEWAENPAISRYGELGDWHASILDQASQAEKATSIDHLPPTIVDPRHPPSITLETWLKKLEDKK